MPNILDFSVHWCLQVRNKALVQYTAPFVTVHLPTMAAALNSTTE